MTAEEALAALMALAPPLVPPPAPAGDWAEFERRNGFPAPPDYQLLVDRYGAGGFGSPDPGGPGPWIVLADPFDPTQSLVDQAAWFINNHYEGTALFAESLPDWSMWPEAEGLLPWATTIDGDTIGWWTLGPPEWWGIRLYGRQLRNMQFSFGAVEFLTRLLRGEIVEFSGPDHDEPVRWKFHGFRRTGAEPLQG